MYSENVLKRRVDRYMVYTPTKHCPSVDDKVAIDACIVGYNWWSRNLKQSEPTFHTSPSLVSRKSCENLFSEDCPSNLTEPLHDTKTEVVAEEL